MGIIISIIINLKRRSLQLMSLYITSLNSGSNGNCYYIGNENEAILVDAGISCREIEKRMRRLGLEIGKIRAVFISHEHTDHISGLVVLSKKYQLPVYITPSTLHFGKIDVEKHLIMPFCIDQSISIGNLSITAFPKMHDAVEPCSFVVSCGGAKVGIFTDIGTPCSRVVHYFKQCNATFLEANYDDTMLSQGSYPYHLKKRISGEKGHLSNKQALDLFIEHRPSCMSHLLLAHLSKNNNCPDKVRELFSTHAQGIKIIIASRYEETAVYHIQGSQVDHAVKKAVPTFSQLSFF